MSTVGVMTGFWLAAQLVGRNILGKLGDHRWILAVAVTSLVISVVIGIMYFWREKSALAEAALEREQRRNADIERGALAANVRALQAQIEPHFLFNTLANVTSLIEPDPARAKHMLETFIRFLRASLAATRRSSTTLADEFALIGDFLEVLEVRMGERLRVAIDLPADLGAIEIPAMLLQPVVENAIRHGLEPKVEGGRIELRARREGGMLVLEVADTGVGFGEATAGGVGLANIRERLRLAHGDAARLSIRANAPQGTIVAIELPGGRPVKTASPKVLVADDEPALARVPARPPRGPVAGGDRCSPRRETALEALAAIRDDEPDAAFLDIRMPGLTGLELAARIESATHVVFVTAYDQYAVEAFDRNAVDYLVKPVVGRATRRAPSRASRRRSAAREAPPELGEVLARIAASLPGASAGYASLGARAQGRGGPPGRGRRRPLLPGAGQVHLRDHPRWRAPHPDGALGPREAGRSRDLRAGASLDAPQPELRGLHAARPGRAGLRAPEGRPPHRTPGIPRLRPPVSADVTSLKAGKAGLRDRIPAWNSC